VDRRRPPPIKARQPDGGLVLVLADRFSVDHLLARVDQGGPRAIIETGSSSYRLAHARNARPASLVVWHGISVTYS
jgi:hypothetical protein